MAERSIKYALPVGFVLKGGNQDYTIEEALGQGGFGITYRVKARIKAGNITLTSSFAVKEFFLSGCWRDADSPQMKFAPSAEGDVQICLADFINEGERLQRICELNTNIVNVNEVFRANNTAYYVMEYLSGGDLRHFVKDNGGRLSEAAMMSILTPVAMALQSLHHNMMLHLDIKPENIVMRHNDDGGADVPVLIDFGIAVHFKKDGSPTTQHPSKGVSPGYSPIEQYAGVQKFNPRYDIYSLAATCFYMLTGIDPVNAFEINTADITRELTDKASEQTVAAIVGGMSKEANARPATIIDFLKAFQPTNALAVGKVVKGGSMDYMIIGVVVETTYYIHYKATAATVDIDNSPQATSRVTYDLWEEFWSGVDNRQEDGRVVLDPRTRPCWTIPTEKAGYDFRHFGHDTANGGALCSDYFFNGTEYVVVRQGYKPVPKWKKSLKQFLPKIKKPALIALATIAVLVSGYWIINSFNSTKTKSNMANEEEQDTKLAGEATDSVVEKTSSEPIETPAVGSDNVVETNLSTTEPKEEKLANKQQQENTRNTKDKDTKIQNNIGNPVTDKKSEVKPPQKPERPAVSNKTPAQQALDAKEAGDLEKLKQLARNGNTTAQKILKRDGVSY